MSKFKEKHLKFYNIKKSIRKKVIIFRNQYVKNHSVEPTLLRMLLVYKYYLNKYIQKEINSI